MTVSPHDAWIVAITSGVLPPQAQKDQESPINNAPAFNAGANPLDQEIRLDTTQAPTET